MRKLALRIVLLVATGTVLAACAESKLVIHAAKQARWDERGTYKVGKPYQINGVWYYPAEDYNYDETGIASWYGPQFHNKQTANGEIFDMNDVTAAHRTLPMPSFVRVTNLENGRSIVVRINDRGPYAAGRIIDLSRRSAQLLGMEAQGTAKVRVQILADESRAIALRLQGKQEEARGQGPAAPSAAPRVSVAAESLPPPPGSREAAKPQAVASLPQPQRAGLGEPTNPADPTQPVQLQPVKGGNRIYVQAGSFQRHENANRVSAKLSGVGKVTVSHAHVAGNDVYRVRMGPVANVEEADRLLDQVIKAGYPDARVVVD